MRRSGTSANTNLRSYQVPRSMLTSLQAIPLSRGRPECFMSVDANRPTRVSRTRESWKRDLAIWRESRIPPGQVTSTFVETKKGSPLDDSFHRNYNGFHGN